MGGAAHVENQSPSKRWLIWPALIVGGLGTVAAAVLFAWPQDVSSPSGFDVGSVDAFAVGSVTTVEEGAFHLVRLSEDEFIALSSRDSHFRKCDVNWEPDLVWPRSNDGRPGWFRAYCSGTVFDITGKREFGPSPRDLDRYAVSIVGDRVLVNTDMFVCGQAPAGAPCEPSLASP